MVFVVDALAFHVLYDTKPIQLGQADFHVLRKCYHALIGCLYILQSRCILNFKTHNVIETSWQ